MSNETQTAIERVTDVLIEHRDIVCVTGDPDVVAHDILDHALSLDEITEVLAKHVPVLVNLAPDGVSDGRHLYCITCGVLPVDPLGMQEGQMVHPAEALRTALLGADS